VPHRERRRSKRVRPDKPLEISLSQNASLQALDISATGLLVEHVAPFKSGSIYEVELRRSDRTVRLRAEVVRSVVAGGSNLGRAGIRYRTAFHFVETVPPDLFALVPELSEAS
jgi:hypothetical protein